MSFQMAQGLLNPISHSYELFKIKNSVKTIEQCECFQVMILLSVRHSSYKT